MPAALFHIVLYEPEIPPNTGNIIRLCANAHAHLHLIHPLGFELDNRKLRRAGLDYREWAEVREYGSLKEFQDSVPHERLFALTTKGSRCYADIAYQAGDAFLFGPETRGLPDDLLCGFNDECRLFLPMLPHSRSLNLANSAAVVLYEAWRQFAFAGAGRVLRRVKADG